MKNRSWVIVKLGTESLLERGKLKGWLDQNVFNSVAKQVALLRNDFTDIVIVSSGAIKAGEEELARFGWAGNLDKKDLAGIGAFPLLNMWGNAFEQFGIPVAQVWVTFANWKYEPELRSIKSSIVNYLSCGVVPVINENDVVSDREIKMMEKGISENDQLARMVAELIEADAVLFITDVGGVYEADPRVDPTASLYKEISGKTVTDLLFDWSVHNPSVNGSGGIKPKIREAFHCYNAGMRVAIAGVGDEVIVDFVRGRPMGTMLGRISRFK